MTYRAILVVAACLQSVGGMARSEQTYTKQEFLREYGRAYERLSSYAREIRGTAEIIRNSTGRHGPVGESLIVKFWVNGEKRRIDFDSDNPPPGGVHRRRKHTTMTTGQNFFIVEQPEPESRYRLSRVGGEGGNKLGEIQVCETITDMLFLVYSRTVIALMNDPKTRIDYIRDIPDPVTKRVRVRFQRVNLTGPPREISSGTFDVLPDAGWVLSGYQVKLKDGNEAGGTISHRKDEQGNYRPLRYEREGAFKGGHSSLVIDVQEYEPHPLSAGDYSLAQFGLEYLQRPAGDSSGIWTGPATVSLIAAAVSFFFWKMANRKPKLASG